MRDSEHKLVTIGKVQGSSPETQHKHLNKSKDFSIRTLDIDGAQADTKLKKSHQDVYPRTQTFPVCVTADIPGAQVSTLKKGIQSKR